MRKPLLLLALLAVSLFALAGPRVLASVQPDVVVSGFSIVNGTAAVGRNFTLAVTLHDVEPSMCAYAARSTISAGAPFLMRGVSTLPVGTVCNGQDATVYFPLAVDPTAVGGFYQVSITTAYESSTFVQFSSSATLNLYVGGTPSVSYTITNTDPLDVYPGDTALVTVTADNTGNFEAQALSAKLSAPSPLTVPVAKSSDTLATLDARSSGTLSFAVEVPKDAPSKIYELTLDVSYLDQNLVQQNREVTLPFQVKRKAQYNATDAGSATLYANENGLPVHLTLTNTGTETADKIRVRILPEFPFSTDGSVRYIPTLSPGQSSPMSFSVDVDKDATPGTYVVDLLVTYQDPYGKSFSDTTPVALTVAPTGFYRAVFLDYWFLWAVAIVIVLIVVLRGVKAKKTKKKR